ncbi:MAG: hypothetical protein U1F76_17585 [Candidatus Competibacteraceae bacterium]
MILTQIDTYEVMYASNVTGPRIFLKGGGKYLGQLCFMPNESVLPADCMSNGTVTLFYHLDDYKNAIDLLRNESPMYLLYRGSGVENGIKTSLEEPVGEAEQK